MEAKENKNNVNIQKELLMLNEIDKPTSTEIADGDETANEGICNDG